MFELEWQRKRKTKHGCSFAAGTHENAQTYFAIARHLEEWLYVHLSLVSPSEGALILYIT